MFPFARAVIRLAQPCYDDLVKSIIDRDLASLKSAVIRDGGDVNADVQLSLARLARTLSTQPNTTGGMLCDASVNLTYLSPACTITATDIQVEIGSELLSSMEHSTQQLPQTPN